MWLFLSRRSLKSDQSECGDGGFRGLSHEKKDVGSGFSYDESYEFINIKIIFLFIIIEQIFIELILGHQPVKVRRSRLPTEISPESHPGHLIFVFSFLFSKKKQKEKMTVTKFSAYAAYAKDEPLKPFEYEPRPLGPRDVEIKIHCCGICHSDIHTIDSGWGPTMYPAVVGHEIIGTVTAKGNQVKNLALGDRVGVGAACWACLDYDKCLECKEGFDQICSQRVFTYNQKYPDGGMAYGGYAQNIRVQEEWAVKVPASFSDEEAAPLMCAGVTVFAPLQRFKIGPGMKVGIVGIGGLGHLALQFAAKMGKSLIVITGISCFLESERSRNSLNDVNQQALKSLPSPHLLTRKKKPRSWAPSTLST